MSNNDPLDGTREFAHEDSPSSAPNGSDSAQVSPPKLPERIGRYRVESILGQGGFGLVYLAHDDQLQRLVAIKVPHARLISLSTDADAYLTEARTVANLDHPHIVPVFDIGKTDQVPCFVVSKYIDGTDLATRLRQSQPSVHESVELIITVAEALHHAHKQGLVHRDIKPGNILLDHKGLPFVGDFGLALREQDVGHGSRYAGTPAYMSPEQARGEGHRVDGRSDIFSLGIVFYEMLTLRRPFKADSKAELMEQVASFEPRPPRQYDDKIPKELDRICLKALSKRASERYSAARDMADDLRHFLANVSVQERSTLTARSQSTTEVEPAPASPPPSPLLSPSESHVIKIVPKGLRSFDAVDSDFFLELLPGPRDRDGLPESIRFWKTRLETTDADSTFSVGLVYGPSGCGKSSLVKAGLLPRLARSVTSVYVETTAEDTEGRLLKGLRRQVAKLPGNLGLVDSLAALRRGHFLESGQKVLLVLDQFEQWLHAQQDLESTDLVQVLRQCDGGRLQCIVMVRDDFWLAISRFMQALEIRIVDGENSRLVDLFNLKHARKVLSSFGKALGTLPEGSLDKDQTAFLDQAVAGLAQDGKVICVRLALFAEMVKGKAWTPATLREVGGTAGVGVAFLDETFTVSTAPPSHRVHQKGAQAVLKALLPEAGTDIKGHMRSRQDLLKTSVYSSRPRDFEDLIHILDRELRLISPTDPEGKDEADGSQVQADVKYYQLTHDYLVPSLRDWLTRKQKETLRGRAELLLADTAAVWNSRPENRQLPSLLQWLQIRWFTPGKNWTPPQAKMMRAAGRFHGLRGAVTAILLTVAIAVGLTMRAQYVEQGNATHAAGLVKRLLDAETAQVPEVITDMSGFRHWTDPLLRAEEANATSTERQKLHASLALLPVDPGQVDYLYTRLLAAEPHEVAIIRDALEPHKAGLLAKLWSVVKSQKREQQSQRLRAAAVLAKYDGESADWARASSFVVKDLVPENPVYLGIWSEAFRPVKNSLLAPLSVIFRDERPEQASERILATNLLANYAADQPLVLADLLMDADDKQFAIIHAKFKDHDTTGANALGAELDRTLSPDGNEEAKERLAKRQANAAVALLKFNQPAKVWPLFKHSPDPRVRSYLIQRLSQFGVNPEAIAQRLAAESDITSRRALLLSLGEFGEESLPADLRQQLLPKVMEIYRTEADAGLHSAAEWLLKTWDQGAWLKQVNDEWAQAKEPQQKRQHAITQEQGATPQWYVNGQGQTMIVIPGPLEFLMGSPLTELDREDDEVQHRQGIGRSFAIAANLVTFEQYCEYQKDYRQGIPALYTRTSDLPVNFIDWFAAAKYCNWLSEMEGIPEAQRCFELKGEQLLAKPNHLSLSGYRLPTEAEMEYVTRAEAQTSRHFGETDTLLPKYGWYTRNSQERTWPVGTLLPNDFGFFDLQGNLWTWCQNNYKYFPAGEETIDDVEDDPQITKDTLRAVHGGSYFLYSTHIRSANRDNALPHARSNFLGMRVARTMPADSP